MCKNQEKTTFSQPLIFQPIEKQPLLMLNLKYRVFRSRQKNGRCHSVGLGEGGFATEVGAEVGAEVGGRQEVKG